MSNVSRDPSLPKGRQSDDTSEKQIKDILGDLPLDRSQLIEALHLIQDEFNCLSQKHLKALSELFKSYVVVKSHAGKSLDSVPSLN